MCLARINLFLSSQGWGILILSPTSNKLGSPSGTERFTSGLGQISWQWPILSDLEILAQRSHSFFLKTHHWVPLYICCIVEKGNLDRNLKICTFLPVILHHKTDLNPCAEPVANAGEAPGPRAKCRFRTRGCDKMGFWSPSWTRAGAHPQNPWSTDVNPQFIWSWLGSGPVMMHHKTQIRTPVLN